MIDIVVDARIMGSQPSGIGFYLFDFLKELIKSENLRFYLLTDVAESEQMEFMQVQNIPVICYGKKVFRSISVYGYFKFVKDFLCREQPDIFWEPNNLVPIKLKGFNGRILLTIHDLFPLTNTEYFSFIYRKYFRYGIKRSIRMADALIYNSKESQRKVNEYFPLSLNKVEFVSYLIVRVNRNVAASNGNYFLYIGNLEQRKGSDLLLKAFERYRNENGAWPLYVGGRIREEKMQSLINDLLKMNIGLHYLGYISEAQKGKWLAECGCFVFPSKAEGFGIPPLEAMTYNKRVITSNLSIFDEILGGYPQSFDINGSEDEQVKRLSDALLQVSESPIALIDPSDILKRYDSQYLSVRLEQFLINMEDYVEDSI